jgi:lathosterol oxidase
MGFGATILGRLHWTKLYYRIDHYGWVYFFFSIVAMIALHDTWFYWTHRAMHWRPLFKLAHRVHHQSHNPTPWAAFSFHPIEAVIESMIYPLVILFLPIHPLAALVWLVYMITMNVAGHLGFELFPRGFTEHRLLRWHNTSVHHNMHHSHIHCNYGLYFNFWDRLMRTNHVKYEEHFERVVGSPAARVEEKCAVTP